MRLKIGDKVRSRGAVEGRIIRRNRGGVTVIVEVNNASPRACAVKLPVASLTLIDRYSRKRVRPI